MRMIVLLLLALVGMSLTSTYADAGAWCASYRRGVSNCGYATQEQCLATVRGLGGFCRPNPFPGTAYGTSAGSGISPTRQGGIGAPIKLICVSVDTVQLSAFA